MSCEEQQVKIDLFIITFKTRLKVFSPVNCFTSPFEAIEALTELRVNILKKENKNLNFSPKKTIRTIKLTRFDDIKDFYALVSPHLISVEGANILVRFIGGKSRRRILEGDESVILRRIESGESLSKIALDYGVTRQAIYYYSKKIK